MKLLEVLLLGKDCGLETVSEAVYNVELHAINLFIFSEIQREIRELYLAVEENNYSWEDELLDVIEKLNSV